jgi:presenilin-like A22 family membrane protease
VGEKFKAKTAHLIPVLASLLLGNFCALLLSMSPLELYQITPFSEGIGSFGNALYFIFLVGIGASILYLLLKNKNMKVLSLVIGTSLTIAFFMLSVVYLDALFSRFTIPGMGIKILILSLCIAILGDLAVLKGNNATRTLVVLFLGGALGAFLGVSIPTLSTVLILSFLSVYDIFAVYYGPVGKIAHKGLEQLKGLGFSFKDVQMGLGDLTFYSMLSGHFLFNFGLVSGSTATLGILVGCFLAFKMLEKKSTFPGLPFPIFLGLIVGFLFTRS